MDKNFELEILASDHLFYRGKAVNLVIPVTDGYFGIRAHHDDIVLCMIPGTTHFDIEEGQEHIYVVTGRGIAMMRGNVLRFIYLTLTFAGWFVLVLFTYGIALIYVAPYLNTAYSLFYRDLKGETGNGYYSEA